MLKPAAERVKTFYRGYDVYDPANVGFDSQSAEARQAGFLFDTSLRGNGNGGHLYGTTLQQHDKEALLEYMKTMGPSDSL
jgi:hypothetical protein